jgi:hypothetical protein
MSYQDPPESEPPTPGQPGWALQPERLSPLEPPERDVSFAYPYGATPGYPAAPLRTEDRAVWALVASIAGFVLCPVILHIIGWVLANQSLEAIRASGGALSGEGLARAARILSIIGLVLFGVGGLLLVLLVVLGLVAATTTG